MSIVTLVHHTIWYQIQWHLAGCTWIIHIHMDYCFISYKLVNTQILFYTYIDIELLDPLPYFCSIITILHMAMKLTPPPPPPPAPHYISKAIYRNTCIEILAPGDGYTTREILDRRQTIKSASPQRMLYLSYGMNNKLHISVFSSFYWCPAALVQTTRL